jgi:hypothetical protein
LERLDDAVFRAYRLPSQQIVTLCDRCELEELLVPNSALHDLDPAVSPKYAFNDVHPLPETIEPRLERDAVCPQCQRRWAYLKFVLPSDR